MLLLFGFAFDQDRPLLVQAAPGLFWLAVLFSGLLAVQRSFAIETADGAVDGLRMSGLEPAGRLPRQGRGRRAWSSSSSKLCWPAGSWCCSTASWPGPACWPPVPLLSTAGVAASGIAYGALSMGLRVRETLLPLLLAPVLAPVVLAATEAWRAALGLSAGGSSSDGWRWLGLLGCFAAIYLAGGVLSFGTLMEET